MPLPPLSDVQFMLEDTGVVVSSGAISGKGILEQPQQLIQDGMVISTDWTVICRADQFGGLIYGDPVTAGGNTFILREARVLNDGILCQLSLEKIAPDSAVPGRHPTNTFGLADLTDVDVSNPQVGDLLVNDGEKWVNTPDVDGGGP